MRPSRVASLHRFPAFALLVRPDADAAEVWAAEIERRVRSIEDGTATLVDGETAMAQIRDRVKNRR